MTEPNSFLINWTDQARKNLFPPLVGREKELNALIHILLRSLKSNPVVVGDTGIGKTALIKGLTQFMASKTAPAFLKNKQIVALDVASILLNSENIAAYTDTVKKIIQQIIDSEGKQILYLPDSSFLVQNSITPENNDVARFLKLSLITGRLNCITELKTQDFTGNVEKDLTLMSVLQPLLLEEPSLKEAIAITERGKTQFEDHYGIEIPQELAKSACQLADRYLKQRCFPVKSLDIIDDACSSLVMDISKGVVSMDKAQLTLPYLMKTVSDWTGVPVEKVDAEDKSRLANAEEYLKKRVIGQDNAVLVVANALRRARSGMQDPNRPIGSFLFIGTTGVGKTELAKSLAEFMFDDETALLRLDMSEYMERTSVTRMIGAPPGTPGFELGGLLTESVRLKPFQVVLFDEIEKAHLDILNLMLQLLDEGRLTDARGITVDFRNTIIILTSNVGANLPSYQRVDMLSQYFRPEFLNRLDDIVSFHQLTEEHLHGIVGIHLEKALKRAKAVGFDVTVDDKARQWFVDEVFTSKFGVRALKRLIQNQVEDPLSLLIMKEAIHPGQQLYLGVSQNGRKIQVYSKDASVKLPEIADKDTEEEAPPTESPKNAG